MAGASPGRNCCQCPAVIDHLSQNELISITLDITIFFRDNEGLKEQLPSCHSTIDNYRHSGSLLQVRYRVTACNLLAYLHN